MIEIQKLIEYSNLAGFPMYINDDKLMVRNERNLPHNLKELIKLNKELIMQQLKERSGHHEHHTVPGRY